MVVFMLANEDAAHLIVSSHQDTTAQEEAVYRLETDAPTQITATSNRRFADKRVHASRSPSASLAQPELTERIYVDFWLAKYF